jgi:23S rRNA (uracil1939-C5)-methyltransferase/tRNA (uracil-5-)-methyltransferase
VAKKRFNDHPFPYHAELELEISTLTNLGVGLGRVEISECGMRIAESPKPSASTAMGEKPQTPPANPKSEIRDPQSPAAEGSRWVVMVPFALPGERVRVRIFRNHKNYSEADLVDVLAPSPERIAPRCPLFGTCGGCQYQNLAYPEQLRWKQRHVAELLRHMAKIEFPVNAVIPSPREFGYRSKITPHFEPPRPSDESAGSDLSPLASRLSPPFPIGFLKAASRFALVDVPQCPIATDAINAALPAARAEIRAKAAAGVYKRGATVLLRHSLEGVTSDYEATITEEIGELKLKFLARDFFQNNPFILPAFTGYVREQAATSGARFLVDAYCGSGLFALSAARCFERVAGVELSASSVRWAQDNAAANGIANATFLAADAAAIFAGLDFPAADTAVVIDPPRRGCDELFLRQLVTFGPRTIVYVSCDPATQMRDLALLQPAGYTLTAVQPFDLFPQTRHLECVITLQKT